MINFTVKNIPEDLHKRLKEEAERNHRSMNGEILYKLQMSLAQKDTDINAVLKRVNTLQKSIKGELTYEEIDQAKRLGRA